MVEPVVESVVAAPAVEPVVSPVVAPVEPAIHFGSDGALNEGWRGTLEEELREDKSLLSFKTVGDLAKSFVNTKKMVGANVIAIPGDTSTEGEWQEYHKAGGRPETIEDYDLKTPEGFPEELASKIFPEDRVTKWKERFFKGGVSQKAATEFINEFAQDMLVDYKAMEQAEETAKAELVSGLSIEWGAAFEQKKHLGNMAIVEGTAGDDEFKARLTEKFGNDPDFIRFSANLGKKFAEGKPPGFAAIPTPNDYQDQIDTLMADPLYTKGTQPQRLKIAEKLVALRKLQKPEPATT
ncbi:hypothetical protein LCGC14_2044270 [marine sediment metagenome]|uniref:Uncharacterized protein n=1 Tax=marine sediment metagenome TaxID=412755 RepID=A0A0F9ER25_9ZZZZ